MLACDPRNDPDRTLTDVAPATVAWVANHLGKVCHDAVWGCVDNYGRFSRIAIDWSTKPRKVTLERFSAGLTIDAFFAAAGPPGEAAIELLSAVLEAPRTWATAPTEAEFLDAIEAHSSLPSPGALFQKVEAAARKGAANEIAAVLQPDPAISASLVNAANAARFAASSKTGSVPQAVVRLGTHFVTRIVFVAEMMARYNKGACRNFDYSAYWANAVANGAAMCGLLDEFEIDHRYADDAFMTGLVSGIGWLTIAETFPDLMTEYIERCQGADPITKSHAYSELFPCRLPLVSERYLERFNFPDMMREAITGRRVGTIEMTVHRNWYDCLARATRVANSISPFICHTVPTNIPVPQACAVQWDSWRRFLA
jgi:HD-like signal output (HDOD) protein